MELTVNGERRELPEGTTISQLLAILQVVPERVVVELNLKILKRAEHPSAVLTEGDQVEIVHFVGGGALNRSRLQVGGSRQLPRASSLQPRARHHG